MEHIYPDYDLYGITYKAYGFLTRGCPRGCDFCIVKDKEGRKSVKVADLSEFWRGQKNIVLLDPNMFACREWENLAEQLVASGAYVDFSQGVDVRIMTESMTDALKRMKIKRIHFAWDRYEDKDKVVPKMKMIQRLTNWDRRKVIVYTLVNFGSTLEQDLERIYTIRDIGFSPYVMIYDKDKTRRGSDIRLMQRWVNSPQIFNSVKRFEDYKRIY